MNTFTTTLEDLSDYITANVASGSLSPMCDFIESDLLHLDIDSLCNSLENIYREKHALGAINLSSEKIIIFVTLLKLYQSILDENGVAEYEIDPGVNINCFFIANSEDVLINDSLYVFNLQLKGSLFNLGKVSRTNIQKIFENVTSFSISHIFSVLNFIKDDNFLLDEQSNIVMSIESNIFDIPRRLAMLKMFLSYSSISYTKIASVTRSNDIPYIAQVSNIEYEQVKDVYDKLSILNSHENLFEYYLNLYHIIEYLMFRLKIKKQLTLHGTLPSKLNLRIVEQLGKLGTEGALLNDYINHLLGKRGNIKRDLKAISDDYIVRNFAGNRNNFIQFLELNCRGAKGVDTRGSINFLDFLPHVIYTFRNMIVHNKDNENNLSYSSLDPNVFKFTDELLIPMMRMLVFYSINVHLDSFKFPYKEITLY